MWSQKGRGRDRTFQAKKVSTQWPVGGTEGERGEMRIQGWSGSVFVILATMESLGVLRREM